MDATGDRRRTLSKPLLLAQTSAPELLFGPFRLSPDGRLFRRATEIWLPPKELQLLRLLAANAGWILSSGQLRQSLWGEVCVSPDSLPRCVSSLRSHLGEPDCIQTVYKRGYRFTLPTRRPLRPLPDQPSPPLRLDRSPAVEAEHPVFRQLNPPRLAVAPLLPGAGVFHTLGAAIAESTLFRLSRMRNQPVALLARDSVFAMAATGATAHQIGAALEAHLALAGTIALLPAHLRIRVEMIRVADAVQLWIEDFLIPNNSETVAELEAAKRIASAIRSRCANYPAPQAAAENVQAPILRRA